MPFVSVIVPVLHDTLAVERLLVSLAPAASVEVVIVDGGSDSALDVLTADRADIRIVRAEPGRGRQMNAGAATAAGRWLLFLHADSQLPDRWLTAIEAADRDPAIVSGWFQLRLDTTAWQARVIERLSAVRAALFGLPYGDQGLFVRRSVFERLGGYREIPLMEDVDFVRRLARAGRVLPSPLYLLTSARRWHHGGWFRRSTVNLILVSLYFAGVSPHRLARWYEQGE